MKAATLRSFLSVHTWVGLVAGWALFIAFYAGAVTVFVEELHSWEQVGELTAPEPLAGAQPLVEAFLARHGGTAHEFTLKLPEAHDPRLGLYWYDRAADRQLGFRLDAAGRLEDAQVRGGFVDFIYDLHFTAGLPRTFGTYLFGVFCVLYGLALVSGVVIYAPVFFKDLFALRLGRNVKRLWQDAHNVIGVLSLPFHVIFAWSGAVLTIGFLLLAPFQFLVFEGKLLDILEADFEVAPHVEPAGVARPLLPAMVLVDRAQAALPGLRANTLAYHEAGDANAQVTVHGHVDQRRLTGMGAVAMNAVTGEVQRVLEPRALSPGTAFLRGLQALHYGNFGHYAVKWLYFLLGLAGAFLFYSGNLLWIEARRKRRTVAQPRRTRAMAALTLGICLGCVAGVSALFLAGAWLPSAWVAHSYYAVFCLCVVWALLRPPARAGHELLWLCTLLTAAIPLAGWLDSGEHLLAALWRGHWLRLGVDATALAMALAFWRLAMATLRRGHGGDPHSVWALPAAHGQATPPAAH